MSDGFEFIDKSEFDRLVGHLRGAATALMYDELTWLSTRDRAAIGLVLLDRFDRDYSGVLFARRAGRYETVDVTCSLPTAAAALEEIKKRLVVAAGATG